MVERAEGATPSEADFTARNANAPIRGIETLVYEDDVSPEQAYTYRIQTLFGDGDWEVSRTVSASAGTAPSSVRLTLLPNPARGAAVVRVELPAAGTIDLAILDPAGRLVRRLASGLVPWGPSEFVWDGRDAAGRRAPSGVYWVRLDARTTARSDRLIYFRQ